MAGISLAAKVRSAVALAKDFVGDPDGVLTTVTRKTVTSRDGFGKPTYSTTTPEAIVEASQDFIRQSDGRERQARHRLTFLENLTIDPDDDTFIVPGETDARPVLKAAGLKDPTGGAFLMQVWLA